MREQIGLAISPLSSSHDASVDAGSDAGLGVLSGSDHVHMNPPLKVSCSRAIDVALMWLLCIRFNAVAD